ncbi:MAG: metallophosphatase [Ignavibacteriales bacterium]
MFDIIGDIHGYAEPLKQLLKRLGYTKKNGCYGHPERKLIFIGDYIDRGPNILETLHIVKDMTDANHAIALLGNHEFNALCFHTKNDKGVFLRAHSEKNIKLHEHTLRQLPEHQLRNFLEWFLTLPLFYETEIFRAVHACWDPASIALLKPQLHNNTLQGCPLEDFALKGGEFYKSVDIVLKGIELAMPDDIEPFYDKEGIARRKMRIKWWLNPAEVTYAQYSIKPNAKLPDKQVSGDVVSGFSHYDAQQKIVFFGHYWLEGMPVIIRENIGCVDFSIANNGLLAAYRYDGEKYLDNSKYVFVK